MSQDASHNRILKAKSHMDGKCPTQWVKLDMIKTNVNKYLIKDGTPCQVADIAFNHKCF